MNLFYLRYFVTLAHVKHYTKAAQQLCITQPSLSHAIAQMEKELGVPLFEKKRQEHPAHAVWQGISMPARSIPFPRLDDGIASLTAQCPRFRTDTSGLCPPAGDPICPAAGSRIFTGIPGK